MNKFPLWTFSMVTEDRKKQYIEDLYNFDKSMKEKGLSIYLIYGTLLGALREHDFILHDSDIDIAYLSKYNSENEVKKERKEIKDYFIKNKMLRTKTTLGIKIKYLTSKFDLWTSWIENNDLYLMPYRNICSSKLILPFKKINFKQREFNIPSMSEQLLDILYITWRIPITKDKHFRKLG